MWSTWPFQDHHITLQKTKGHASPCEETDQHWEAWANDAAENAAKQAIIADNLRLYDLFHDME